MKQYNMKPVIDISWWQDPDRIDYDKLAQEIDGAIIRIGYGSNTTGIPKEDNRFRRHYDELKKRGVAVGGYWYSTAINEAEVKAEVDETLRIIEGLTFEYPIAWDTEDPRQSKVDRSTLTDLAKIYCEGLIEEGFFPIIYSFGWWLENRLNMNELKNYDVWVASLANVPDYKHDYTMWQYTWTLNLNGYDGPLDGNRAYRDYPSFMKEQGLNGYEKPKAPEVQMPKPYAFNSPYRAVMKIQGYTKPFWQGEQVAIKRVGDIINSVERIDIGDNAFVYDLQQNAWYLVKANGRWQVSDARVRATYTVKKGDNLWKIAHEMLGDGDRYPELADLNKLADPNKIKVGMVLKLPFK